MKNTGKTLQNISIKFRIKIFLVVMFLILAASAILGYLFSIKTLEQITDIYGKNTLVIIEKNNDYIDSKLHQLINGINNMTSDYDFYNILSEPVPVMRYDYANKQNAINNVILKYFNIRDQDIYSISIMTSTYEVGKGSIPYQDFINSSYYSRALAADGKIVWEPGFSAYEELHNSSNGTTYVFAGNQLIKSYYVDKANNIIHNLPNWVEKPILSIALKDKLFKKMFSEDIPTEGTQYFIAGPDGVIVSASDNSIIGNPIYDWMDYYIENRNGIKEEVLDSNNYIICFDTSDVTDWTTIILMRKKELMNEIYTSMGKTFLIPLLLVPIFSVLLIIMMTNVVTKPFNAFMKFIRHLGEGKFGYKMAEEGPPDIRRFISSINQMSDKLNQLIIENYEIKLHEKEAHIQALNLQLRPHFMYNTLNLINCMAIEKDEKEISKIIIALSKILQYTAHNENELSDFKEEMDWLDNYIFIMCSRYEGKVNYIHDIAPDIYSYKVPKMLLQPFFENAFIHGFESIDRQCTIELRAWIEDDKRFYTVKDNGAGIISSKLEEIDNNKKNNIGINNVNTRIQLIYGKEYGVKIQSIPSKGTLVKIVLPLK